MELFWLLVYALSVKNHQLGYLQEVRAKVLTMLPEGVFIGAGALLSTTSRAAFRFIKGLNSYRKILNAVIKG